MSVHSGTRARSTSFIGALLFACVLPAAFGFAQVMTQRDVERIEKPRVIRITASLLQGAPRTVSAVICTRSAGGKHEYFSEGDYWWPDPANPEGPYVRKDGYSNPGNFIEHRTLLRRMSVQVPALVAAFKLTGERKYARAAMKHLRAWFIDTSTMMNPSFAFSQAIKGVCTGRAAGIIDGVHLAEVAQSVRILEKEGYLKGKELARLRDWFCRLMVWLTTHPYGTEERNLGNNHAVCWAVQVASYALLVGDSVQLKACAEFYRRELLPGQMSLDGSYPKELARTKPYAYSLFTMDAMTMLCQIIKLGGIDLYTFRLPDGRYLKMNIDFMVPFIRDREAWQKPTDVMYHELWPVRHPALLFAGLAYNEPSYVLLWTTLDPDPTVDEILRNFPYRQPILWFE
jgi:hypothetical protein